MATVGTMEEATDEMAVATGAPPPTDGNIRVEQLKKLGNPSDTGYVIYQVRERSLGVLVYSDL